MSTVQSLRVEMSLQTETILTPVTQKDIEDGLRQLGIGLGDAVEVHSSLSSFGWVEGGASAVVDALMNVISSSGALVMSAYPVTLLLPLTENDKARGITARVRFLDKDSDERTGMGAIADEFRQRPTTVLGTGKHRVCAWGKNADLHSQGYEYLLDMDGWVLLLGVDIHCCSSMHIAESRVGIPKEISESAQVPKEILRDYPPDRWYVQYGEPAEDTWGKVQMEAERRGLIERHHIGRAESMLFKARDVIAIYEEFLRTNPFGLFGIKRAT